MMRIETKKSWISVKQLGPENAEDIVLITGFIGASSFWDPILPILSQQYRVTIFDQRGTGNSGSFDDALNMNQMADDAELVLDSLCTKPVHLIGHSAGSGISLILAGRRPDRVKSISLLAGWTKADAWMQRVFDVRLNALAQSGSDAYAALTTLFMTPPADVASLSETLRESEEEYAKQMPAYEDIKARADAVLNFDSDEWAEDVNCPTLVMGAKDDVMTPFYFSEALSKSIAQSQLYALDTGGHYFPRTRPKQMTDVIINFLNKHNK